MERLIKVMHGDRLILKKVGNTMDVSNLRSTFHTIDVVYYDDLVVLKVEEVR